MEFLQARREDVDEIYRINQKFLLANLPEGSKTFLMGNRPKNWIHQNLEKYFVVKDANVLGYAEIDFIIGHSDFTQGTWESKEIMEKVLSYVNDSQFVYLIQIASEKPRKGVGQYLINQLSQKFQDSIMLSFVAYKPYFNEISLNFHEKTGFIKAGEFKIDSKFGIQGYERICYFKDILDN